VSKALRVLYLSPRHPYPPTRGDQLRVFHLARALSVHAEVVLASFGTGPPPPLPGVRINSVSRGALPALASNLGAADPLLPLQARLYLDRRMKRMVSRELERFRPHVIHLTLARLGPYASCLPGGVHVHVDFVDALSLNMESRARASRLPARHVFALEARLMRRYEARLSAAADSSSVVSERDRRASPGLEAATVIPNGVAVDELPYEAPRERPARMLFFGNLGYFHNVGPARMVALEVLPRLRGRVAGARLRLAGARPAAAVRELAAAPGVELVPDVPDMVSELHGAALAVLPMHSGSGMKNKVLEAFSAGTPVVTNRAGIDGLAGALDGVHYLEAEDPGALAECCAHLLEHPDERVRLAERARALVEREYSWASRAEQLVAVYSSGRGRP
jgi:glycosyltransferase involved in cell wall biosynthesis